MINLQYVRAENDTDRDSYGSAEADWIDHGPSLEYRFTLQEAEDDPQAWEGGLEKLWVDEDRNGYGEFFLFAAYVDKSAFDAEIAQIRQDAKTISARDNL